MKKYVAVICDDTDMFSGFLKNKFATYKIRYFGQSHFSDVDTEYLMINSLKSARGIKFNEYIIYGKPKFAHLSVVIKYIEDGINFENIKDS